MSPGTQLKIDQFTFLADAEGKSASRIQTEVDAGTKEEAYRKARRLFTRFLQELTLVGIGQFELSGSYSIQEGRETTATRSFHTSASLGIDGNTIKAGFEKNIRGKSLPAGPLTHYADGINASDLFVKYREFYKVLEFYFAKWKGGKERREKANAWINGKVPGIAMKKMIVTKTSLLFPGYDINFPILIQRVLNRSQYPILRM